MSKTFSDIWPKRITVDKRIVKILSESTYENFPNALKEVIINSYDAKATIVEVNIDLKQEQIIVLDNGIGMSESDFDYFLKIAGKTRQRDEVSSTKRKIIGQFGVGFVSIFPFFENYEIETKKTGRPEILKANIPCYRYFDDEKLENKISDISSINITGKISIDNSLSEIHYTKTTLTGFTRLTKNFFNPNKEQAPRKHSIHSYNGLEKLIWKLEEDLPIKYEEERYNLLFRDAYYGPSFDVLVNERKLTRKVWGSQLLETQQGEHKNFGKIKVKYFIATERKVIRPNEAKHIKIRNLNVGVGDRTAFGLGEDVGGFRSKINWLTGEVHILEGMNDLIKVSRDGFNFSPDYEKLKDFFIIRLSYHSTRIEKENELDTFLIQEKDTTKVNNIKLLEPEVLKNKIRQLQRRRLESKDSNILSDGISKNLDAIDVDSFRKTIVLNKKRYNLVTKKWDFNKDQFPACKIEGQNILLNKDYPFFKRKSQTDFFVKLHFLLLINYHEGTLDQKTYEKLTKDIIHLFKDYL